MNLVDILQAQTILQLEKVVGDEAIFVEPVPGIATKDYLAFLENESVEPVGQLYAFVKDMNGDVKVVLSLKGRGKKRKIRVETREEAEKRDAKIKAKLSALA